MMVFAIAFDPSCDPSGPGVYSQLWLPRISGPTAFVPNSVRLDGRNDERIGLGDEHGAGGDSSHCSFGPATHPQSPAFVEPRSIYIRRAEILVDFAITCGVVNNSVLTPACICHFLATSHWTLASPPASARTDSVPTIVAKGNVRPEFLRIPQCSRFRREVLRSRTCSGVSRLLDGFARLRHRHRTQGEQRYYRNDRELVHVCSRGIGSSGESISPVPQKSEGPGLP